MQRLEDQGGGWGGGGGVGRRGQQGTGKSLAWTGAI